MKKYDSDQSFPIQDLGPETPCAGPQNKLECVAFEFGTISFLSGVPIDGNPYDPFDPAIASISLAWQDGWRMANRTIRQSTLLAGKVAASEGIPRSSNPYVGNQPWMANMWFLGWDSYVAH